MTLDFASDFAQLRQLRVAQRRWGTSLPAEPALGRAPFREDGLYLLPPGLPLLHRGRLSQALPSRSHILIHA